jgi:hypothetical protein
LADTFSSGARHPVLAPVGVWIGVCAGKRRAQAALDLGSCGGDGGESNYLAAIRQRSSWAAERESSWLGPAILFAVMRCSGSSLRTRRTSQRTGAIGPICGPRRLPQSCNNTGSHGLSGAAALSLLSKCPSRQQKGDATGANVVTCIVRSRRPRLRTREAHLCQLRSYLRYSDHGAR